MPDFIVRDMLTGTLGEPLPNRVGFEWMGGGHVHMRPAAGLEVKTLAEDGETPVRHERVYEIVELDPTGAGTVDTPGTPEYDEANDRVTRAHVLSLPAATSGMVQIECARRLALGFDYDFGDDRGVHRIATTKKDMEGWREVTDIAAARVATADETPIAILTETGAALVTPMEWQAVLKAAAAFRQPIWAASFALQNANPIPDDYAADEHWTGQE